jgi:hypothetical protein
MKYKILFAATIIFSKGILAQKISDSTAIRLLLEKESATWRAGDVKAHADCWQIKPYSRILVSMPNGRTIDVPPASVIAPPKEMVGQGGYAVNSNYKMSITKNNAWVSHDELSVAKNGTKSYSYEIRLLEKIKGKWKLVGQSIHIYQLTNEQVL